MSSAATRKLRGGYYTPADICRFLSRWAVRQSDDVVLEPSFGDGAFLEAVCDRFTELGVSVASASENVSGSEIDAAEVDQAYRRLSGSGLPWPRKARCGDFFSHAKAALGAETRYSCVLGNPPFIRYQDFPAEQREIAYQLLNEYGFSPNGLTNAWVPFVLISALLLDTNGRLAMVIPAELFQVKYAAETRRFLNDYFDRITIVTVNRLLFKGAQQEVVLLLAERRPGSRSGIRTVELESTDTLDNLAPDEIEKEELKPVDHAEEKWTKYFLDTEQILLLRQLRSLPAAPPLGDLASVDVGVVTGRNDFFVLTDDAVDAWGLSDHVTPIVTRSAHLQGTVFDRSQEMQNRAHGYRTKLLNVAPNEDIAYSPNLRQYLRYGEQHDVPAGYKCRIRRRWYSVPSTWRPDAFALRQVAAYPKLILNSADATCTDTIHRVRFFAGVDGRQIVSNFVNSLTFAISEVTGRSYGGGVMTYEPTEIERLPVPSRGDRRIRHAWINRRIAHDDVYSVLEYNDARLLTSNIGLASRDIVQLRTAWERLRDRRLKRKA